ncbi:hypothetical protein N9L26_01480 [Candidatus Pacebacteria bacterium]|nr:hypothetical protein [Candidatus Paceibacterota bacterium]
MKTEPQERLQKNIMRRIYYAFAIRLATHPLTVHTILFMLAAYILASLVYVERVLQTIAQTQVGDLGTRLMQILVNADTASILALGVMIFAALSLPLRLPRRRRLLQGASYTEAY